MAKAPRVTAGEVIRVLERIGFALARSSGSHRIYKNDAGKRTTVPFHNTEILHPKTFASILRDIGLSADEFYGKLREQRHEKIVQVNLQESLLEVGHPVAMIYDRTPTAKPAEDEAGSDRPNQD